MQVSLGKLNLRILLRNRKTRVAERSAQPLWLEAVPVWWGEAKTEGNEAKGSGIL